MARKYLAHDESQAPTMNILIFNWRDLGHPKAGGAELATHQLAEGLSSRGHRVTWFTSTYPGARGEEERSGYRVVRRGTELTCRFHGLLWLWRNRNSYDVVVDEVNTLPFLSKLVMPRRVVVLMHQLAREVWLAEAPPIVGHIGFALESVLMSIYHNTPIVTISDSSAESFRRFGIRAPIHVAEITLAPRAPQPGSPKPGRIGYVGRLAPSKRVDHIVRALAMVRERVPEAHLEIVGTGSDAEVERLTEVIKSNGVSEAVTLHGRLSNEQRDELMRSLDVLAMTSLREGWGLVVSEAARYAVPSVVYPVAGLIDSVVHEKTGLVTGEQSPRALADAIVAVISDRAFRDRLGDAAAIYLGEFDEERYVGRWERVLMETAGSQ